MGRFIGNGRPPTDPVDALLGELGLAPGDSRARSIAEDALDPDNPLRELDLIAHHKLAGEAQGTDDLTPAARQLRGLRPVFTLAL